MTSAPRSGSAQDLADLIDLSHLAVTDSDEAVVRAEMLLDQAIASEAPDIRIIHDLMALRAQLLKDMDDLARAAQAYAELAAVQDRNRDLLGTDPVPAFRHAAKLFEEAGDLRSARRMLATQLELELGGGQGGDVIAAIHEEIARLAEASGAAAEAEKARVAAEMARQPVEPGATRGPGEGFRQVDVYYGTDRARSGSADPRDFYGYERGELELGVAMVTIPDNHVPGQIEAPSIWRLEFGPEPARHIMVRSVEPLDPDSFFVRLSGEFADQPNRDAFVFIHGYNVTFENAAKRAAQIAQDMDFPGVPILYSWPSRGSTIGYIADTAVVRLSGRRLADFLEDVVARSGARSLHIVAHSMGNRALTDALEIIALKHGFRDGSEPIFGQVLFAAPDVDQGLFARMVRTIRPVARRLTLYASENDWALVSSRKLHGDMPRAGQGGAELLASRDVDSIDMSALGEDMLAHSYFADDSSALADILALIWQNSPPERRCGMAARSTGTAATPVWDYQAGKCATRDLIAAIATLSTQNVARSDEARAALGRLTSDPARLRELEPVVERLMAN